MLSPEIIGLGMLGTLFVGIFVGFPVSFTLLVLATAFGYVGLGEKVFYLETFAAYSVMTEETFAACPLFIFMGHILQQAGLLEKLFNSFQELFSKLRGSLYIGVIFTSTLFACATGIIGASTTIVGMLAAPSMTKSRYRPSVCAGLITAGGCLGILIPPSVMLVVMGPVLGVSVINLFAGALFPGLLLSGIFLTYCLVRCWLDPSVGPPLAVELRPESFLRAFKNFIFGAVPLGFVIFSSLGTIILGMATPTEAAAMGASGALVLAFLYRKLNYKVLKDACIETLRLASLIQFLVVTSSMFGNVFTSLGAGRLIVDFMLSLNVSTNTLIFFFMAAVFILGWPLEWPPILFIFVPIFLPILVKLNVNLTWFGILLSVNFLTAFLSPPVAMSAYYLKSVAPQWTLQEIFSGMIQFMILQVIGLVIVFLFPELTLYLPGLINN